MGSAVSCCLNTYDISCCFLHCGRGFSFYKSNLYYCPSCLTPIFARLATRRIVHCDIPDQIKYILDENENNNDTAGDGGDGKTKNNNEKTSDNNEISAKKIIKRKLLQMHNWCGKDKAPCAIIEKNGELAKIEKSTNFKCTVVKGKIGYTRGIHVWEIVWPRKDRDRYSCIGVATKDASLFEEIGSNKESWGWNLYKNKIKTNTYFPSLHKNDDWLSKLTPAKLQLILDLTNKTLAFMAYGKYLGIACDNLVTDKPLYLAMSGQKITSGVSAKYLGAYDTIYRN